MKLSAFEKYSEKEVRQVCKRLRAVCSSSERSRKYWVSGA
jgi:hypothetical protein